MKGVIRPEELLFCLLDITRQFFFCKFVYVNHFRFSGTKKAKKNVSNNTLQNKEEMLMRRKYSSEYMPVKRKKKQYYKIHVRLFRKIQNSCGHESCFLTRVEKNLSILSDQILNEFSSTLKNLLSFESCFLEEKSITHCKIWS